MRVVPRENEAINEIWIADRDRFSYEGVYSPERLEHPLIRRGRGVGRVTDWESALTQVARRDCKARAADWASSRARRARSRSCISPRASRADSAPATSIIACASVTSATRRTDPLFPGLGMRIADVDALHGLLIVGSNLRREVPILAHRVRKAARRGAQVALLNPARFPYLFPVDGVPHLRAPRTWWPIWRPSWPRRPRAPAQAVPAPLVAAVQRCARHR